MSQVTAIGVDIGGTNIRAARIAASGEMLAWEARPTASDPSLVGAQIGDLVGLLEEPDVCAIGIGVPGRVDWIEGLVLSGGYVDLTGQPLAEMLAESTGRPVVIDNDGNMALFAEHALGGAQSARTAVMFTIGTGIGGAVIVNGELFRGRSAAGQLGHITVDGTGQGRPCMCGRRGCVETLSSGTALASHIADAGLPLGLSVATLVEQARAGEPAASNALSAWAAPMRVAIDTAVAIFDPEVVVIGGGLGAAMHEALGGFPAEAPWYQCNVVAARLGDRAGVIGAGLSALAQINAAGPSP